MDLLDRRCPPGVPRWGLPPSSALEAGRPGTARLRTAAPGRERTEGQPHGAEFVASRIGNRREAGSKGQTQLQEAEAP